MVSNPIQRIPKHVDGTFFISRVSNDETGRRQSGPACGVKTHESGISLLVQGGFDPSKKSGVGVDFELLVRCLLLKNKVEARKPSMIFR